METKFTQDGKKVAVLGKLNNNEWIVQQIFVADGEEFPSGENFVTRSLLDKPAETYLATSVKKLEKQKADIESEIKQLDSKLKEKRALVKGRTAITEMLSHYAKSTVPEIQQLIDFLEGKINYIVKREYSRYEILTIEEALVSTDNYGDLKHINVVSVYGLYQCKDRNNIKLNLNINQYNNGIELYFCQTLDDAIARLDLLLKDAYTTPEVIALKEKYRLYNPTQDKIEAFYKQQKENAIKEVAKLKRQLEEKQKIVDEL